MPPLELTAETERLTMRSFPTSGDIRYSFGASGQVAQLVEHGPEKAGVGGSSPPLSTLLSLRFTTSS